MRECLEIVALGDDFDRRERRVPAGQAHKLKTYTKGLQPESRYVFLILLYRKVDIRLPGKENSYSRGARPVY